MSSNLTLFLQQFQTQKQVPTQKPQLDDVANTKEFMANPLDFSTFSFSNSKTVANTMVEEINIFAQQNDFPVSDNGVNRDSFKYYIALNYGNDILNYYSDNGVEYEDIEQQTEAVINTACSLAFAMDIDVNGDIAANELETILNEIDTHENWNTAIILQTGSGTISQEGFEAMFNILTTGEETFYKYDKESHEENLIAALKGGTYKKMIDSTVLAKNDIRMSSGAKFREGLDSMYEEDFDATVRLFDYVHYMAINWWGYNPEE
ncbi:hypothetical protein IJX73_01565 [bacterium]|nr:hypothetical protein [bacterium]MBQ9149597.1 hypothetical protein [bacterium]